MFAATRTSTCTMHGCGTKTEASDTTAAWKEQWRMKGTMDQNYNEEEQEQMAWTEQGFAALQVVKKDVPRWISGRMQENKTDADNMSA